MVKILAINPGSTSTKIGYFEDKKNIWSIDIHHRKSELDKIKSFNDQKKFRKQEIINVLKEKNIDIKDIDVFAPRGGICVPLESGTYEVTEKLCHFQETSSYQHPCNLACPIAFELANENGTKAYFTDSPVTFEAMPIAQLSGVKEIKRNCRFHALNQKAVAKWHCEKLNIDYKNSSLIVAHLGGGITVGAHYKGRVIDVNDGLEEGPFSADRCGGVPIRQLIDMCYTKDHNFMKKFIQGNAGLISYLNKTDFREISKEYDTNEEVKLVVDAMIYQIACEIGKRSVPLKGKVDGILITGGIANSKLVTDQLKEYIGFISHVYTYPGEFELEALAYGAYNVYTKQEPVGVIEWK